MKYVGELCHIEDFRFAFFEIENLKLSMYAESDGYVVGKCQGLILEVLNMEDCICLKILTFMGVGWIRMNSSIRFISHGFIDD